MSLGRMVDRPGDTVQRKLIRIRDLLICVALFVCTILSIALSRVATSWLCKRVSRVLPGRFYKSDTSRQIAASLDISENAGRDVMRNTLAAQLVSMFAFVRGRIMGSSFDISLEGGEHIDTALAEGEGVVLWLADLVYAGDVSKIGLAENGFFASHLSRPEHGFSDSRFGVKVLNPIRHEFELRYLRERIVYQRERPDEAGKLIRERLGNNGIVSIFASGYEGRSLVETEFLRGQLRLAGGAPRIAFKQQCPVLPLFVIPIANNRTFEVRIGEPLKMTSRNKEVAILEATEDFLSRLKPIVEARPELWRAWSFLRPERGKSNCPAPNNLGNDCCLKETREYGHNPILSNSKLSAAE